MSERQSKMLFALVAVLIHVSAACDFYKNVECASHRNKYNTCYVSGATTLVDIVLVEQMSTSACEKGISFGLTGTKIWVKAGCRGKFNVCSCKKTTMVKCQSNKHKYSECKVTYARKVKHVTVAEQLSSSSCTFGQDFGINGRSIWVTNGCRAMFEICYK